MSYAQSMTSRSDNLAQKPVRLEARVSLHQKQFFLQAADLLGVSLTEFLISSLNQAATEIIEKQSVLHLSVQDQKLFVDSLLHPKPPSQKLVAAKKRHQRLVQP